MLMFGYENEYFLRDLTTKKILTQIPSTTIPHDAYQVLVEVRSEPFTNPFRVLESFNAKYLLLAEQVRQFNCELANITQHQVGYRLETAGFHIHFSGGDWTLPMGRGDDNTIPQPGALKIYKRLEERFLNSYKGVRRHPETWRPKPYGWEYRRLPATVSPEYVTQVLAEEFWAGEQEKAA